MIQTSTTGPASSSRQAKDHPVPRRNGVRYRRQRHARRCHVQSGDAEKGYILSRSRRGDVAGIHSGERPWTSGTSSGSWSGASFRGLPHAAFPDLRRPVPRP